MSDEEVAGLTTPDGAGGFVRIVTALLSATFGASPAAGTPPNPPQPAGP